MYEPREVECALETKAFKKWRNSGKATRESCPLHITTYEKVMMIEKAAYMELVELLEEGWRAGCFAGALKEKVANALWPTPAQEAGARDE